jgi:hypothetical protein
MMLVGDDAIEHLYQLPLDEFTAARNALAKRAKNAAEIRGLGKPPLAAWAVNQLYWQDRSTWDALIDAAENLRNVNKAVLGGRAGDVRAAGTAHDAAVHDALKATLGILETSGHPPTDAVRQAVVNTLRALPADDPPGRLTRSLQPGGFEMLSGMSIAGRASAKHERAAAPSRHEKAVTREKNAAPARSKADARALTQARETAATATRVLREAEQAVRRHEFEIARSARDEERAARSVEQARQALDAAKNALANAEREQKQSAARRQAAEQAARKAEAAVNSAQRDAAEATTALKKLERG